MTIDEITSQGGYLSPYRDARLEVQYPGKKRFWIILRVSRHRTLTEVKNEFLDELKEFYLSSFPDGTPLPDILRSELGELVWRIDL